MNRSGFDDTGRLLLRVMVGGMMLLHGIGKLRHGVAGIETMARAHGLPGFIAYGSLIGEVVAPLLVLAGFYARLGGLVIAFNMVVAIYLAHQAQVFTLGKSGGWAIELQMFYLLGGVAIFLLGAGRIAVRRGAGRFD